MRTCKPLNDDSELSLPAYDYDSHVAGKNRPDAFPPMCMYGKKQS